MLVRLTRAHLLPDGEVGNPGDFADIADDAAYGLIWKGAAIPSLRLRVLRDGLYGDRHFVAGDVLDWPPPDWSKDWPARNSADPERFDAMTAVVPVRDSLYLDGEVNIAHAGGVPVVVDAFRAWEMVQGGARYATPEEAAALLPPIPTPPESAKSAGSVERMYARVPFALKSGQRVGQGTYVDVPADEVDELLECRAVERLVKARVAWDGVIVDGRSCAAGDVVSVPADLAEDSGRFEPAPLAEKAAGAVKNSAKRVTGRRVDADAA